LQAPPGPGAAQIDWEIQKIKDEILLEENKPEKP